MPGADAFLFLNLGAAVVMGLMASGHCLLMCGGISGALGMAAGERQFAMPALFSLGRVGCYALLGLGAGALTQTLGEQLDVLVFWMRLAAGLMLIAVAGYIGRWWLGLTRLEALGQHLWRYLSPFAQKLMPVRSAPQALALGLLWGFLPCGLIYSALLWSALQADEAWQASLLMAGFGAGTLPAMVGIAWLGQRGRAVLEAHSLRRLASVVLLAYGVWTIAAVALMPSHPHNDPATHHDHLHRGR